MSNSPGRLSGARIKTWPKELESGLGSERGRCVSRAGCGDTSDEHEVRRGSREYRALFQESWQRTEIKPEERSLGWGGEERGNVFVCV